VGIRVKFYEDLPATVSAPPFAYRRLMPLMLALHVLGFLASLLSNIELTCWIRGFDQHAHVEIECKTQIA